MPEPRVGKRFVPPESFVRSYDPPLPMDPWTFLHRYQQARRLDDGHPVMAVDDIAAETRLPAGRLEEWIGGDSRPPKLIREFTIAGEQGWIDLDPGSDRFRGMNVLVGSTFGPGSIDPISLEPRFRVRSIRDIDRIAWAINEVGVQYAMVRNSEDERAKALRPTTHGPVLGRILVLLGAPVGDRQAIIGRLPPYLGAVDREHRLAFARTVIESRATRGTPPHELSVAADQPRRFLDEFAALLADIGGVSIARDGESLVVPSDAVHSLGAAP